MDSLEVVTGDGHRFVAPFHVTIRAKEAHIEGQPGVKYQVLVDGERIVDVESRGKDLVPLGR